MLRRIIPILCFFSISVAMSQEQQQKGTLRSLMRSLPEDTTKLDVYFQYGFLMEDTNLDSAAFFYKKANEISRKHNHLQGQIRFVHNYSYILNLQGKLDEALALNREGLRLARKHNLELDIAKALANLGSNFSHRGQYDSAMTYYLEAADLFKKLNVTTHLAIIYQNIGVSFDATEQFERAIEYGMKALASFKSTDDSLSMVSVLVNIGGSISSLHDYDSALKTFEQARQISKRINSVNGVRAASIGIGDAYAARKESGLAIQAFNESLAASREMNYPGGAAIALNGLAMVMYNEGRYLEADKYATEALLISEQAEHGVFADLRQQYKLLAEIKAERKDLGKAYHYLEKYVTLNDSLSGTDVRKMTASLERKYQLAQKESELAQRDLRLQQIENNVRRKNAWLLIFIGGLILLTIILILLYRYFHQRQRLQAQEVLALQQQQEVIKLRSTLEGQQQERTRIAKEIHDDIGSGLTSLVFMANTLPDEGPAGNSKDKITGIARQMVNQMNEIVWSLNSDQDTLEDLVIYTRHSISETLETVGMEYEFHIPAVIPTLHLSGAERRHLFLVIKEAVHNSIKHSGATRIIISMDFTESIHITVEDNGKGLSGENKFGNGLKNMQFRMKQIGGDWKLAATSPVKISLTVPIAQAV